MKALSERDIRRSFVNCTKGEAERLRIPTGLDELPWSELDFLGWRDPGAPERAHLVAEHDDRLVGVALRAASGGARGFTARSICSLCLTTRTGGAVVLMTARRAGPAGRGGNSVGQYLCSDLACSLYIRGRKRSVGGPVDESLSREEKIARTRANLDAFLTTIIG